MPDYKKIATEAIAERRRDVRVAEELSGAGLTEFVRYLHSPWHIIWVNLIAGIFRGLGFVLGATVVLTAVVFVFVKVLGHLPVVGDWFAEAGQFFADIQAASQTLQGASGAGR